MKKELKHSDLIKFYKDGEQADNAIYAEQRSNLMLVAGNHYTRKGSKFWNRIKEDRGTTSEQKIRVTSNHIQRICKIIENNILTYAPTIDIEAKNMSELQDQKAAELNKAVWNDLAERQRFKQRTREFCQDFTRVGETCAKIYWDETKGRFLGYNQATDELGQPMFEDGGMDMYGNPMQGEAIADKKSPKFSGDLVIERIFGFNVFRAREAKTMDESWFIGIRKMVNVDELKSRVNGDEQKLKYIQISKDETFVIFDGNNTSYRTEANNQCLVMEMYIRPSNCYPNGYYYIYTNSGILFEGELPFGVFPIVFTGYDEVPTNPRYHSIIKHLRPYQSSINMMASAAAEARITTGQDKIITQIGAKMQNGSMSGGIRNVQVSGAAPTILPGRTGDQWLPPMQQAIDEMYQVANMAEDIAEKPANQDAYAMLFQTMEQKKKYVIYVTKFSQFLIDTADISLKLFREYATEDSIIPAIGRSELVNITEFKNTKPLNYQIKIESGTEDMESKMGRQLMFNHTMQYVGANLDKRQLGQMFRLSPYANNEQAFEELTMDYDNATNMVLAIDRGTPFQPNENDDPKYMMQRLVTRMRKADFLQLQPQIQQAYQAVYQQYVQINAVQLQQIKAAQAEFIPMAGMAVVCEMYVPDPKSPEKTMRARVPYDSLAWLLKRLEEQGIAQQELSKMAQGAQAGISQQVAPQQQNAGGQQILPQ
jgi:hypothetical protein